MTAVRFGQVAVALILVTATSGCGIKSPDQPLSASSTPTRSVAASDEGFVVVDPTIVTGINAANEESLQPGQPLWVSLPVIPGAEPLTTALRSGLEPQVEQFRQFASRSESDFASTLNVTWKLVAASPYVIGVRLDAERVSDGITLASRAQTKWWDPAVHRLRLTQELVRFDRHTEFFSRLDAAIRADPLVEPARLDRLLATRWDGVDSITFTPAGNLWVELDPEPAGRPRVATMIRAEGLLSSFGELAQAAALTPTDPSLSPPGQRPSPTGASVSPTSQNATVAPVAPPVPPATPKPPAEGVDCAKAKCVALTFDDGPTSQTEQLLNLLKQKGVRATFFVVGSNVTLHPNLVRRMVAEGHTVGNHSWSHSQLTGLDAAGVRREITRANAAVIKAGAPKPVLLRPPYGATNKTVAKVAKTLGMSQIMWSLDPLDWKERDAKLVARRVLGGAGRGSIVLSHDIRPTTFDAYAQIIDQLLAKGFTLVTVPELLGTKLTPGKSYYRS